MGRPCGPIKESSFISKPCSLSIIQNTKRSNHKDVFFSRNAQKKNTGIDSNSNETYGSSRAHTKDLAASEMRTSQDLGLKTATPAVGPSAAVSPGAFRDWRATSMWHTTQKKRAQRRGMGEEKGRYGAIGRQEKREAGG